MREHHAYLALGCVLLGMLSLRQPTRLTSPYRAVVRLEHL